jgi:hypothetical protein
MNVSKEVFDSVEKRYQDLMAELGMDGRKVMQARRDLTDIQMNYNNKLREILELAKWMDSEDDGNVTSYVNNNYKEFVAP